MIINLPYLSDLAIWLDKIFIGSTVKLKKKIQTAQYVSVMEKMASNLIQSIANLQQLGYYFMMYIFFIY